MNSINNLRNQGFFTFNLGRLKLFIFSDGLSLIEPIQPSFAPNISEQEVQLFLNQKFLSSDNLTLAINILLISVDEKLVLIDTGCGPNLGPTSGKLLERLLEAGINPNKITDIVLTHAHPDHIGGILTSDDTLAFPNADIYLAENEYNYWTDENPDFSKGTDNDIAAFEIQFAKHHLTLIKNRITLYDEKDTLFDFLKLDSAPGHTPGHTIITVFSEGEELVHVADTFQHVLLIEHPEWGNQIDSDFLLSIRTRKKILEELYRHRKLIFGNHLPYPGLGYIDKELGRFRYISKSIYTV